MLTDSKIDLIENHIIVQLVEIFKNNQLLLHVIKQKHLKRPYNGRFN